MDIYLPLLDGRISLVNYVSTLSTLIKMFWNEYLIVNIEYDVLVSF